MQDTTNPGAASDDASVDSQSKARQDFKQDSAQALSEPPEDPAQPSVDVSTASPEPVSAEITPPTCAPRPSENDEKSRQDGAPAADAEPENSCSQNDRTTTNDEPNKLRVITTGDVFVERYLWSKPPKERNKLPYVWPEELRTARKSATRREYGGAVIHSKIIRQYLNRHCKQGQEPLYGNEDVECQPSETFYREICRQKPYPPLAVMLHELRPVAESVEGMATAWRIERCFGVVSPADPFDDVSQASTPTKQKGLEPVEQLKIEVDADKEYWQTIKNLLKLLAAPSSDPEASRPTVVVINDRDIADDGGREYSTRTWMEHFFQFLEAASFSEMARKKGEPQVGAWPYVDVGILARLKSQIASRHSLLDAARTASRQPIGNRAVDQTSAAANAMTCKSQNTASDEEQIKKEITEIQDLLNKARTGIEDAATECALAIERARNGTNANIMVLWHTRHFTVQKSATKEAASESRMWPYESPYRNAIYEFLDRFGLVKSTIMLVNHMCLREAGIELRFDQSYESSIRNIIASLGHSDVQRLLQFPQVLIRYDYGVMHLTTSSGRLAGLDIHGLLSGPYRFEPSRYGMVTGTMPLFSAAIIDELHRYVTDVEGGNIQGFLAECSEVRDPTNLHSTRLDRAIDTGLLLARRRFSLGFGKYDPHGDDSEPDLAKDDSTAIFRELFEQFGKDTRAVPEDWDEEASKHDDTLSKCDVKNYRIVRTTEDRRDEDERDKLVRLGVPDSILRPGSPGTEIDAYLRTRLFGKRDIWAESRAHVTEATVVGSSEEAVQEFLHAIVLDGFASAVQRKQIKVRNETQAFVQEPSVLCPYVELGNYCAIDAHEIDQFLEIRYLISNYCLQEERKRPLNLGIFGAPGSGKSSSIVASMQGIEKVVFNKELTCNLSQLRGPDDLGRYFHRWQDIVSAGKVPVAFFDEFDSKLGNDACGWLKFFLMPMQDGRYSIDKDLYDLSSAIFVFAGGVNHSFDAFSKFCRDHAEEKAPDFKSRLTGFIDIPSLQLPACNDESKQFSRERELAVKVRRAVMLRGILSRCMSHIFDKSAQTARINPRIIDAFLSVRTFENSLRSMEAIVTMSKVPSRLDRFEIACLPSRDQIRIHVDPDEFYKYVNPKE